MIQYLLVSFVSPGIALAMSAMATPSFSILATLALTVSANVGLDINDRVVCTDVGVAVGAAVGVAGGINEVGVPVG